MPALTAIAPSAKGERASLTPLRHPSKLTLSNTQTDLRELPADPDNLRWHSGRNCLQVGPQCPAHPSQGPSSKCRSVGRDPTCLAELGRERGKAAKEQQKQGSSCHYYIIADCENEYASAFVFWGKGLPRLAMKISSASGSGLVIVFATKDLLPRPSLDHKNRERLLNQDLAERFSLGYLHRSRRVQD
jgi:hypothetical protein